MMWAVEFSILINYLHNNKQHHFVLTVSLPGFRIKSKKQIGVAKINPPRQNLVNMVLSIAK